VNFIPSEKRVLIFVVAYNAEKTLSSVLKRIPPELHRPNVEVLVIDDFSQDQTFAAGLVHEREASEFKITMLRTPENQGYGGNQKLGYRYAIEHGFDVVALMHGDGQYAPEKLPALLEPFFSAEPPDAVFGSRMMTQGGAREGGMPLYKYVGNKVLTTFQNTMLGTSLSEFHSGYRLYATEALRKIPFERNSNDFHFDTEIIIQLVMRGLRILELPIPTYYGDEICHVNGMKYAWDVFRTTLRSKLHERNLLFDRRFEVKTGEEAYPLKLGFPSSHTMAIAAIKQDASVLDIGCGRGYVAYEVAKKATRVVGIEQHAPERSSLPNVKFYEWNLDINDFPINLSDFDQILILDVIEHLKDPEMFMDRLRLSFCGNRPEIILTTANVAFFITRLMLLFGYFNYGRRGILDRTHTRLFTSSSLWELLDQSGYRIIESRGIPAPYPAAIGDNWISRLLISVNEGLIQLLPNLFSYQIFIRAIAQPTVDQLLVKTVRGSEDLKSQMYAEMKADSAD
jgi:glycosyltransferase involved in cell wall biosynthesis